MSSVYLPSHLSVEARDLIERLLQKDPRKRLPLADVLSHPFMCRSTSLLKRVPSRWVYYAHFYEIIEII